MKWCFLINNIDFTMEFFGKLAAQVIAEGDECILVFNSKIAEYRKFKAFPKEAKVISKVDWLAQNYRKGPENFSGLSWKEFFSTFERKSNFLNLNYKNSVEIVSQLHQFFDFLFKTENPDIVINEAPANIFTSIAYFFCQKYNKTYLGFVGSRINNKLDIYDKVHTCSLFKKTFMDLASGDISDAERKFAENFVENFLSHKKLPSYMNFQTSLSNSVGFSRYLKREIKAVPHLIKYILNRAHFHNFDYESENNLKYKLFYPWRALLRKFKGIYLKKDFNYFDNNDEFFIYPLHFNPEASTLVLATYFSDQLNTIKNIAFSLPFPYKLYVKEHPTALGTRPVDFYKEIKRLPNVVLIVPEENVKNLIKKSMGVITLTGTMGMEAALAGKPVYVLGDVFYTYHPLCVKVEGFEDLRQKINDSLMQKNKVENLEEINRKFILSYFRNTIQADDIEATKDKDTNNYPDIYKSVKNIYFKINENRSFKKL
jgi:hypothetical protein